MDALCTQTIKVQPRSDAELRELVQRLEAKWQRRRKAHRVIGWML